MTGTIQDWEDARAVREIADDLDRVAALPTTFEAPAHEVFDGDEATPDVVCLRSRLTAGLGVQLLWRRDTDTLAITLAVGGREETYDVPRDRGNDAFDHPYVYGGTIVPR